MDILDRGPSDGPHRPSCLIVEDQALIGMALEAYLQDAGLRTCEPLDSRAAALAWLAHQTPDLAILDFALRDGDCTDVAAELKRRNVPFVFYSGRSRERGLPPELQDAPWIEKPCDRPALIAALSAIAPALFGRPEDKAERPLRAPRLQPRRARSTPPELPRSSSDRSRAGCRP